MIHRRKVIYCAALAVFAFVLFAPVVYQGTAVYPPIPPGGPYAGVEEFSASQYVSASFFFSGSGGKLTISSHGNAYQLVFGNWTFPHAILDLQVIP
ncbi:MAG: hypothetical protein ACYCT2_05825 [Thermoplasmataceae archaeon]